MKKQFSKTLAIIIILLFIFTLLFSFGFMTYVTYYGYGEIIDYVVCTTAITIVAGLLGLVLKSYYSKAGLENVAHIRRGTYEEIMRVRLEYDSKVLELRHRYNIPKEEIDEIENDAPFKEMSETILGQTAEKLDEVDAINSAEPEIERF